MIVKVFFFNLIVLIIFFFFISPIIEVQIENVNLEEKFKNVEHINKVIEIAEEDEDEIVIISGNTFILILLIL